MGAPIRPAAVAPRLTCCSDNSSAARFCRHCGVGLRRDPPDREPEGPEQIDNRPGAGFFLTFAVAAIVVVITVLFLAHVARAVEPDRRPHASAST
jgi:hypothetical protein